jgi:hypothetical protein
VRGHWAAGGANPTATPDLIVTFTARRMGRRGFGGVRCAFPSLVNGLDHLAVGADLAAERNLGLRLPGPLADAGDVGLFTDATLDRTRHLPATGHCGSSTFADSIPETRRTGTARASQAAMRSPKALDGCDVGERDEKDARGGLLRARYALAPKGFGGRMRTSAGRFP